MTLGTTFKFSELRKLYDEGFTPLWIKARDKAPVDTGWTKAPRPTFESFKAQYRKGYNVGVRLGKVSKVAGGYLAVLDVDVKGLASEYCEEAEQKLYELFPEAKEARQVLSGRGNGSRHVYVRVPEPTRGNERKAQSSEIVQVYMPSVEPSKREVETLSQDELKRGMRLRPAWEISLLCEGRQVVLPGSVHPDSGLNYVWADPSRTTMPIIPLQKAKGTALTHKAIHGPHLHESGEPLAPVKLRTVPLESLGLRPDQVAAIRFGAGVTDRSASLFGLTMALLQRRVPDADIMSVFTDRNNYLGQTPYDHAKTSNRQLAVRWFIRYTFDHAKAKVNESEFAPVVEEEENQASSDIVLNGVNRISGPGAEAYLEAGDWKKELDLQPGPKGSPPSIRASFKNICMILENTIGLDFLRFDEFSHREFWAYEVPWGPQANQQRSAGTADEIKLKSWLIEVWGVEVSVNMLTETLAYFSGQNHFHPVKDYLDSLTWDGEPRIDTAFETYLGVKMARGYTRAVSRKFFLALMARIYEPGCKFDHLPVLEGKQGIGKSTFGRILVGEKWFMDGLPDLADKDAALNLTGIWLCEMSELSSLYRSQLEVAKAFITRQVDKVRPPYGARRVELPRSTVFLGTTNDRDYLVDETGNRRFWPILIHGCDFDALQRDREQLLAEAHWCYLTEMEPLYLQGNALRLAEGIQESRRVEDDSDSIASKIFAWITASPGKREGLKNIHKFRMDDLFDHGPLFGMNKTTLTRKKAGAVLRKAGYQRVQNNQGRYWVSRKDKPGGKKKD